VIPDKTPLFFKRRGAGYNKMENILRGKRNAGNTKYALFLEKVNVEL